MDLQTDLALEATELLRSSGEAAGELPGVATREYLREGFSVTEVKVLDKEGAQAIGKPEGTYLTLELRPEDALERSKFCKAAEALADVLRGLLPLKNDDSALVVGLGNRAVTPDALGPMAVEHTVVTRHLVERLPETFGDFRPVAAVSTGVLGTTGMESGELVQALCKRLKPDAVIAVDALAARSASRLGSTVQLADTGIVPGSGVGNARYALDRAHLGVPVIAIGVPTVIRASALCADLGGEKDEQEQLRPLIVTPKEIDSMTATLAKTVGVGISLALQGGLTVDDVEMLLS